MQLLLGGPEIAVTGSRTSCTALRKGTAEGGGWRSARRDEWNAAACSAIEPSGGAKEEGATSIRSPGGRNWLKVSLAEL